MKNLKKKVRDQKGQGLAEYLILLILIAVISIGAAKSLGNTIKQKFKTARHQIFTDVDLQP